MNVITLHVHSHTSALQVRLGPDFKNLPGGPFWCASAGQPSYPSSVSLLSVQSPVIRAEPPTAAFAGQFGGPGTAQGAAQQNGRAGAIGGAAGAGTDAARLTPRALKPVETRALQWHAWGKAVLGWEAAW